MQAALDTQLSTLSGGYDIAWPNITYKPVGQYYIFSVQTLYLQIHYRLALGTNGKDETQGNIPNRYS